MSDTAARLAALAVGESIILQAPAGSGKTTILTQRFLALLATVEQPEEVLAITFTRKAAAEMRRRLSAALSAAGAAASEKIDALTLELAKRVCDHSMRRGWQLEAQPSRLRIMTIDSLNRSIAAATPISGAGAGLLPVGQFPQRMHLLAARRCLEDAEEDPSMQEHAERIFRHLDNHFSRTEKLLAQMLNTRSQWLPYLAAPSIDQLRATVEMSLRAFCSQRIDRLERALGAAAWQEALELLDYARGQLGRTAPVAEDDLSAHLAIAQGIAALTLTGQGKKRQRVNKNQGFPAAAKGSPGALWKARMMDWLNECVDEAILEDLASLQVMPPLRWDAETIAVTDSLIALLRYAAAQLELLFAEQREIDYIGVAVAARAALDRAGPASDLVIHQGESLRHLLVDEFQDTSLEQFRFITALVQDWRNGDGRTLFLVGDPMQSIYRFREAEVGLFMRAQQHGIAAIRLQSLQLSRNFRSASPIIDFVNDVFAKVFPAGYDAVEAAIPYLPSECATLEAPEVPSAVHCHWLECDQGRENDSVRARQIEKIVDIVNATRQHNARARIAILVHTRKQAHPIVTRLVAANHAVRGVDLVPLAESPVVEDLLALTRFLLWPDDRIAALAILRAPWCGLTLADLHALCGDEAKATLLELWDDTSRLEQLSASGRVRLQRLRECIESVGPSATAALHQQNLAQRAERLWLKLDGPSIYALESSLQDARRYLDVLGSLVVQTPRPSREDLEWILKDLFSTSTQGGDEGVQVMTIHGAKGLEFDCVILPALSASGRWDQPPLVDWITWDGGDPDSLLLAPVSSSEEDKPPVLNRLVRRLHKRRELRENARVLYVAATRAKASLHLVGSIRLDGEVHVPTLASSPLSMLWPALADAQRQPSSAASSNVSRGALIVAPSASSPPRGLRRLPEGWRSPAWPADVRIERLGLVSAELAANAEEEAAAISRREAAQLALTGQRAVAGESARAIGIVIHRELEAWIRYARQPAAPQQLEAEQPRLQAMLQAEGVDAAELARSGALVVQGLSRVLSDEPGRWILTRRPTFDAVELALTGRHEGRIISVVIDRCFVEAGVRWVIDYKSARPEGGDLKAFLAEQADLYRPQLERYVHFARKLGPEPVKAALYFVFLGQLLEIDVARA